MTMAEAPLGHRVRVLGLRAWRRFPWPGGRGRDRAKSLLVRDMRPPRPVPTTAGWLLLEHGEDALERHLLATGAHWEAQVERLLRDNATGLAGATVIDVGGHVGYYAALLARLVGPRGKVVVVEARPELCERIEWARQRNRLGWLDVVHGAAAAAPGPVHLGFDGDRGHTTAASATATLTVPGVRLDEVAAVHGLGVPRLVMMDIEGGEASALVGMSGLLGAEDPPDLLVEVHPDQLDRLGTPQEAVVEDLRARDRHDLFVVDHRRGVRPLEAIPRASSWHLLATRRGRPWPGIT